MKSLRLQKKMFKNKNEILYCQFKTLLKSFGFGLEQKEVSDFKYHKRPYIEFIIKEVPNWYFCSMWNGHHIDGDLDVVFGEHRLLIDKFKPSRSPVSCFSIEEFVMELCYIKHLPKRALVNSLYGFTPSQENKDTKDLEGEYNEFKAYHKQKQDNMYDKFKYCKSVCKSLLDLQCVKGVGLNDFNGLFRTGYRYNYDVNLIILIDEKYQNESEEFFNKIYNEIEEGYVDKVNRYKRKETGRLYLNNPTLISTFREFNKCQYKFLK